MRFHVETTSATPIYAQLIAQMKQAIAAGVLRAGDALPSLRELASELRVNPLTIAKAYRELEQQGIIVTEHGRGSFIAAQAAGESAAFRREAFTQAVDTLLEKATQLGVPADEVLRLVRQRLQGVREIAGASKHSELHSE